jgi:DNA/RNA-binding domain of Phe-tRNA-synthetase-like protein
MIRVSDGWKQAFPGAHLGVLSMTGVSGPARQSELDKLKRELETDLRAVFTDPSELKALEPIKAYQSYYKRFKKTYHVVQQLESVALKNKPIPHVSPLVEAMFMAELRNMLLTAGHDLDLIRLPLLLDVARGTERYTKINGQEQVLKAGDMFIGDGEGVISSVIHGPDRRTMITAKTRNVLYTVYAVPGVSEQELKQHLEGIETNVKAAYPEANVGELTVWSA